MIVKVVEKGGDGVSYSDCLDANFAGADTSDTNGSDPKNCVVCMMDYDTPERRRNKIVDLSTHDIYLTSDKGDTLSKVYIDSNGKLRL